MDAPPAPEGLPADQFKMPSLEELLKSLEGMDGLSDEQKEELKDSLTSRAKMVNKDDFLSNIQTAKSGGFAPDFVILMLMITIIGLIFVFFGYKLYRSLMDRERRREEKKRLKQQKKKK